MSRFISAILSTMAAFFGVQSNDQREQDFQRGKPQHFIIAGFLVTALFVLVIVLLVKFIMASVAG